MVEECFGVSLCVILEFSRMVEECFGVSLSVILEFGWLRNASGFLCVSFWNLDG